MFNLLFHLPKENLSNKKKILLACDCMIFNVMKLDAIVLSSPKIEIFQKLLN